MALFNLLTAFPMDGGRVLRASLISFSNRVVATRIAAFLGQCLAGVLLLAGLLFRDPFLPLIATFVLLAAWVESRMSRLDQALQRLPVGQFSVWDMGGVRPDDPLSFALRGRVWDVAVVADGVVIGVLWREDVLARIGGGACLKAREVMDTSAVPISTDTSVYDAHRHMLATGHPAIPIVNGGIYRGIFTAERLSHVYRYLQEKPSRRVRYREIRRGPRLDGPLRSPYLPSPDGAVHESVRLRSRGAGDSVCEGSPRPTKTRGPAESCRPHGLRFPGDVDAR